VFVVVILCSSDLEVRMGGGGGDDDDLVGIDEVGSDASIGENDVADAAAAAAAATLAEQSGMDSGIL
jgi:hypothetical protein